MPDDPTPDSFLLGYRAYLRGETIDQCQLSGDSSERLAWIDGWEFGKLARTCEPEGHPHDGDPPASP